MEKVKISIVVPVYNVEDCILQCLQSVVNQNYDNLECIIVDDCGTDQSITLCKQFLNSYDGNIHFSIIQHKRNLGLSAARNTGLKNCDGEYVLFLDSDDWLKENAIKLLVNPLNNKKNDFVIGNFDVSEGKNTFPKLFLPEGEFAGSKVFDSYSKSQWYMMAWNKLCRRNFLLDNQLFFEPGILHEDDLWSFRLAVCAKSFYVKKCVTYIYRVRQGSIMQDKVYDWKKHHRAYLKVVEKMLAQYRSFDNSLPEIFDYILTFTERHIFYNHKIDVSLKLKEYYDYRTLLSAYSKNFRTLNRASRIRHSHYLMPTIVGFGLFLLIFKIKNL